MKLTWIGKKRHSPAYGILNTNQTFNATAADGKDFIRQGLAVQGKSKRKESKTKER